MKKLFWILFPGSFSVLATLSLSLVSNVNWNGIIFYSTFCTILMFVLCFKNYKKMLNVSTGLIVAGTCFSYASSIAMDSPYQGIFLFLGVIIMAFVYFFVWLPAVRNKK